MSDSITEERLEEIAQRCEAATPGPWRSFVEGRDHVGGESFVRTEGEDIYLIGASVADQDFIAAARQDIPLLLNEVRVLRKALATK
jgi:hypothetical protein